MPEPLPFVEIEEPTVSMTFGVNDSPFTETDGTYITSRHLRTVFQRTGDQCEPSGQKQQPRFIHSFKKVNSTFDTY